MRFSRTVLTVATQQRFELDVFLEESSWSGLYDRFEVWRSRGTAQGPYEPLHGDSWLPARLPLNTPGDPPATLQSGPPAALNGTTLELLINEVTSVTVTFSQSNPVTYGQAATAIQTQSAGLLTAFVLGDVLVVQTQEPGAKVSFRCSGGDAAPLLGLPTTEPGSLAFGLDARIVLRPGVGVYSFVDPNGSECFYYKTRFYNSFTGVVSDFSVPYHGASAQGLSPASVCVGYVNLVSATGAPGIGQAVLVYGKFNGLQLEGKTIIGGSQRLLTDSTGHAELPLARGSMVVVAIEGTTLARDVVIPTDPTVTSVDLLAGVAFGDDLFDVQVPKISYATRRSL